MPLPEGAELCLLPGRRAVTMNEAGQVERLGPGLLAVAAILPMGYTRTLVPAFEREENAPLLPLFGYAAVALKGDALVVAAVPGDDNEKWHPYRYNTKDLRKKVKAVTAALPQNRIVKQLGDCSLKWHCCTAQNLFYRRWEAGIPTSPVCNANCLGCISLQPAECCPSPQSRIQFSPTVREVAEIAVYHLSTAPEAIISFGQGCEGEPLTEGHLLEAAIALFRARGGKGTVNLNSNASDPAAVAYRAKAVARVPVGREGTPAEVAAVARLLASEGGAYVNSQMLQVNGGAET